MEIDGKVKMEQQTFKKIRKAVDDFGSVIEEYRKKEILTFDSLAMRVGCSAAFIFRAEKGSRIVPLHMRVRILKNGLNWKASDIERYLIETIKGYEQKNR